MRPDGRPSNGSHSPAHPITNGSNGSNGHTAAVAKTVANGRSAIRPEQNGTSSKMSNGNSARQLDPVWNKHSREEVSRLMIQALQELGYSDSADALIKESGCQVETPNVAAFKHAILEGQWDDAELLILGQWAYDGEPSPQWIAKSSSLKQRMPWWQGQGLTLVDNANNLEMLFWIRQQKYLELLEARNLSLALEVLRKQLTPHSHSLNTGRLHFLGGLMMCSSAEDLMQQANWDGASGNSRRILLAELSRMISPTVMIPDNQLSDLLHEVKDSWMSQCLYHNTYDTPSLFTKHTCNRKDFPDKLMKTIAEHTDEIWYLCFSHDGKMLASAGKDRTCIVYDVHRDFKVLRKFTHRNAGVCYIAWSPDNSKIITCTREPDNSLRIWDIETGEMQVHLHHFNSPPTAVTWLPNGEEFLVGSIDKSRALEIWNVYEEDPVYLFPTEGSRERIYDVALSPDCERMLAMGETTIYVYDFPSREQIGMWKVDNLKMTSIVISQDSRHALVSMNPSRIHLIDIETGRTEQVFEGHKQDDVIIRSAFGGATQAFVISGSEDSSIFVWRSWSGELIEAFPGHGPNKGCVNAVAWHPTNPAYFASAGDDGRVKIWGSENYASEYEAHQGHLE